LLLAFEGEVVPWLVLPFAVEAGALVPVPFEAPLGGLGPANGVAALPGAGDGFALVPGKGATPVIPESLGVFDPFGNAPCDAPPANGPAAVPVADDPLGVPVVVAAVLGAVPVPVGLNAGVFGAPLCEAAVVDAAGGREAGPAF